MGRVTNQFSRLGFAFALVLVIGGCQTTPDEVAGPVEETMPVRSSLDGSIQERLSEPEQQRLSAALALGEKYLRDARWHAAAEAYDEALGIAPDHPAALTGRETAMARLDLGSALDLTAREISLRRQGALMEFESAYADARDALADDDFAYAKGRILRAKVEIERLRRFLAPEEFKERTRKADELMNQIETARELHYQIDH